MPVAGGHLMVPAGFLRALIAQKRLLYFANLFGVPMDVDDFSVPMDVDVDVVSFLSDMMYELNLYEPMDVSPDVPICVVSSLSDSLSDLDLYEPMDVDK